MARAFGGRLSRLASKAYTTELGHGEPRYNPKYPEHPPCGVRCYTDGQTPGSVSDWLNDAIALPTLALYTSWLHILLALSIASFFWRPAAIALAVLVVTTLLPARPLRWQGLLQSRLFESWRKYFHFSFLFEEDIDESKDYLFAQFPHGAFPLGPLLGATSMAVEFPAYKTYLMAANSVFSVPFWRHFNTWLGAGPATRKHFKWLMANKAAPREPATREPAPAAGAAVTATKAAAAEAADTAGAAAVTAAAPPAEAAAAAAAMTAAASPAEAAAAAAVTCGYAPSMSVATAKPMAGRHAESGGDAAGAGDNVQSPTSSDAGESPPHAIAFCRRRPNAKGSAWQLEPEQHSDTCSEGSEHELRHGSPFPGHGWEQSLRHQDVVRQQRAEQPRQQTNGTQASSDAAPSTSRQGTGIALVVGGIAEMFLQADDHEAIYLHKRKGFVALALEAGIDIVPVYSFGNSSLLSYRAPRWLAYICRKLRCSVGLIYGRWGLVIPRKQPVMFVLGRVVKVSEPMSREHPEFERRVREVHARVVEEVVRLYHAHRGQFGWGERPLVVL